jgi:hypothetical protein
MLYLGHIYWWKQGHNDAVISLLRMKEGNGVKMALATCRLISTEKQGNSVISGPSSHRKKSSLQMKKNVSQIIGLIINIILSLIEPLLCNYRVFYVVRTEMI